MTPASGKQNLRALLPGKHQGHESAGNNFILQDIAANLQGPHGRSRMYYLGRGLEKSLGRMKPAEREEALERREANAALLSAKLEKDRLALESEIAASAAAAKAASAISRALQADANKKLKQLQSDCAQWETKLTRLKSEVGNSAPAVREEDSPSEKAAVAAERSQLANERASFETERAVFEKETAATQAKLRAEAKSLAELRLKLVNIRSEIEGNVKLREAEVKRKEAGIEEDRARLQEGADSFMRAEAQQAELRTKLEAQLAALAAKEVMVEERSRQLQERMRNFAKA